MNDLRQLAAEFAEKVLSCRVRNTDMPSRYDCGCQELDGASDNHSDERGGLPEYHTDLTAAWAGVEKLKKKHKGLFGVRFSFSPFATAPFVIGFVVRAHLEIENWDTYPSGDGTTPAEALVRACLEAVR